jgi:excisionase family DNA binding protein
MSDLTAVAAAPRLYTVEGAADYCRSLGLIGVTVSTVRRVLASGELKRVAGIGKRYYVSQTAIHEWLSAHEKKAS